MLQADDIRTEYHPRSGLPSKVERFEDYKGQATTAPTLQPSKKPWLPFRSRVDFEFSEIALKAALNKNAVDALITLIHRCVDEKGLFTLNNHADISKLWEMASSKLTKVCHYYLNLSLC